MKEINPNKPLIAIIPAGGIGKRMSAQKPKQFLTLNEEPILCITLKTLASTALISRYIIPTIDIVYTKKILKSSVPDLEVEVCKGGKTRQESVCNALDLIRNDCDPKQLILVHDAVRALVRKETIQKVIEKANITGAAIAARPLSDTIKLSYNNGDDTLIKKNIPRDHLWLAQTPQVYTADTIIKAYDKAKADHFTGTDSASLVERLGIETYLVESPQSNIKITTPEDLELAQIYLKMFA